MDDLPTPIRETLAAFARGVRPVLGENLMALYCFGSLCTGDFDAGSSDIDFLAIVDGPLSAADLAALDALHHRLARASVWGNRLEGGYARRCDLRSWGIAGSFAMVAPGERLRPAASSDYSEDNMLAIRQHGLALHGPSPATLLPPVDPATLAAGLRAYLVELLARPAATAPGRDVATWALNIARCLYGLWTGRLPTKAQAARWVGEQVPTARSVLDSALRLRTGSTDVATEGSLREALGALLAVAATYVEGPPMPSR